mgnify:FL=1
MKSQAKNSWYVAQLKPNGFNKAQLNLSRQGFECFMPMRKVTLRHARKLTAGLRPIFPGYIFIKFGLDNADWRKINSTLGVNRLISFHGGRPAQIPEALMAGFMARCDDQHMLKPISDWKTGDTARLISGPFADFIGEVEELVSGERVKLLFKFMEQYKSLEVSSAALERLS